MARGDKSKTISADKEKAAKTQKRMQSGGASKRTAERRAWDSVNQKRGTTSTGTAGGRSKVSKRTTRPSGSTSKTKTTGKTRR